MYNNMRVFIYAVLISVGLINFSDGVKRTSDRGLDEDAAAAWLTEYDSEAQELFYNVTLATWNYQTNISDYNWDKVMEVLPGVVTFRREMSQIAGTFDWRNFTDTSVRRQFQFITNIGLQSLSNDSLFKQITELEKSMQNTYSTAKVCLKSAENCLRLDPEIEEIFSESRDYDELQRLWTGWRMVSGRRLRQSFTEYVNLTSMALQSLGEYENLGEYMMSFYESDSINEDTEDLLEQVMPLYKELHAYVRTELQKVYRQQEFSRTGHIPAHLLGNKWAAKWTNIYDIVKPYRNLTEVNVTYEMMKKNFTVMEMFKLSEEFFTSLGFQPLPPEFWKNSMLERPFDRDVVCHPSAWDFLNAKDFRIKMCTDITADDLMTVHHEMGHTVTQMAYSAQPLSLRYLSNPGFHEAIGDTIALSTATPKHLHAIGLAESNVKSYENSINFLMRQALKKVSFIPFSFVVDKWKQEAFSGSISPEDYNRRWWNLRCIHQGVSPPEELSVVDFDPGSIFHVISRGEYTKYFISTIVQFQFYKALCDAAGHEGPLHECDFYNSTTAGQKLIEMLKTGSSRHWRVALEMMTGQQKIDAEPLLEYFKPLFDWLKIQNREAGVDVGWFAACPSATSGKISDEFAAEKFMKSYDTKASQACTRVEEARWLFETNITDYNKNNLMMAYRWMADFNNEVKMNISLFDWENFHNTTLKRLFQHVVSTTSNMSACSNNLEVNITTVDKNTNICNSEDNGTQAFGGFDEEEMSSFQQMVQQLIPFYNNLYGFTRRKLWNMNGEKEYPDICDIHLDSIGDALLKKLVPYPNMTIDITPMLKEMKLTPKNLFMVAEEFYLSLGFDKMPEGFWNSSMLTKPDNRDVSCWPSVWDFCNGKDFRMKMCTEIDMDTLFDIHRQMGFLQYALQYRNQPFAFRGEMYPGFKRTFADVVLLSVTTPEHLQSLGFLENYIDNKDNIIHNMMSLALKRIASLPFAYNSEKHQWNIRGLNSNSKEYKWRDVRSFINAILQFQLHESLCDKAGHTGPLHKCDIYQSKKAGSIIRGMLQQGRSHSWQDILEMATGARNLSVQPLLDYFDPLIRWLEHENVSEPVALVDNCNQSPKRSLLNESQGVEWLEWYNTAIKDASAQYYQAYWIYMTNITDLNKEKRIDASLAFSEFSTLAAQNASMFDWRNFTDQSVKRQFRFIEKGRSGLDKEKLKEYTKVRSDLQHIYSEGESCITKDKCLKMNPNLTDFMAKTRNFTELQLAWKGWRDGTGRKMKDKYAKFVELSNENSRAKGYKDTGDYWRSWYETPSFEEDLKSLLGQLKVLYRELHTYVRGKLEDVYGRENFPSSGHIPAHLFGRMWGQNWVNIYDLVVPFPNSSTPDLTKEMRKQNYTALKMFKMAEEFFESMGFEPLPATFWNDSIIERPKDGRQMVCHASAWDFGNSKDFRIKMCADVTIEEFRTIHHELGHIFYYTQYKDQPYAFRDGANNGFHEAIGDVVSMFVDTTSHLHKVGLLPEVSSSYENDINFLMSMALNKIAFLPFGYLIDKWRWSVFSGETPPEAYNKKWWELRCKYQGISPAVERSDDDFDPGAKYHIPGNTPYIRYFISHVLQFQFLDTLCNIAGHTGPLHTCDIYQSKEAGRRLRQVLSLGSSRPWPEALEILTGHRQMSVQPLIKYFRPLIDWLKIQNHGKRSGWEPQCGLPRNQLINNVTAAKQWMETYNNEAVEEQTRVLSVEWQYSTNITDDTYQKLIESRKLFGTFEAVAAKTVSRFNWRDLSDESLRKQFSLVHDEMAGHMAPESFAKLMTVAADMERIYSEGKVCLGDKGCLSLVPGLTEIMATSRNYSELQDVWKSWRDVVGPPMKEKYAECTELINEGAQQLGYTDAADYWQSVYGEDVDTFKDNLASVMDKLMPLYKQLHTYVKNVLRKHYGAEQFPTSGHIPAHLLGNMWAQEWSTLYDLLIPYPEKGNIDVTDAMRKQNYSVVDMFELAEEFFTSLGLPSLPKTFWDRSQLTRPEDGREVVCHGSAWDFYNSDVRISMCTTITLEDLVTVHHEIGHLIYYLLYKDQPVGFRTGANPGFHEAVGDTISMSVVTPKHLFKIGLLDKVEQDNEATLNFLMRVALQSVAFLPFSYVLEQWRWGGYSGEINSDEYNQKWWDLRCSLQGISPPVMRTNEDFDPGAKYHIPANVPYIRYFVSVILQFQFHEALCKASGHIGPLFECDIYQSKQAGKKLSDMLELGASIPWEDALEKLTGTREMDAGPLLRYFKPLYDWLEIQNRGHEQGWDKDCSLSTIVEDALDWLSQYDQNYTVVYGEYMNALWDFKTNLTDQHEDKMVSQGLKMVQFRQRAFRQITLFDRENLKNINLMRQLGKIADIGVDAIFNRSKNSEIIKTKSSMEKIYRGTNICMASNKCLQSLPDLNKFMATIRDSGMLQRAWTERHNTVGRPMRPLYKEFVQQSNEAITHLGYDNTGSYWRSQYENKFLRTDLEKIVSQLYPLYEHLHAYVRRELRGKYGGKLFPASGHIPAHLLGSVEGKSWRNIFDIVKPFKNEDTLDMAGRILSQNYTVTKMFQAAEDFFKSLGFLPMTADFWKRSILSKPPDGRRIDCQPSAWDLYSRQDYRVTMCAEVNLDSLLDIFRETGHIEYKREYSGQPVAYKTEAFPGFHSSFGGAASLSAMSASYLYKLGLTKSIKSSYENEINSQMKMALDIITSLPFSYIVDMWRWNVFNNNTSYKSFNSDWWNLRCKHQGVYSAEPRTDDDFDAGAIYQIPHNIQEIGYFMSSVLQFQIHKSLCNVSNHNGPLHTCNIYNSTASGKLLANAMKMGSSVPWTETMELIVGHNKIDTKPLLEYFKPLMDWLLKENYRERPGWSESCPPIPTIRKTEPVTDTPSSGAGYQPYIGMKTYFSSFIVLYIIGLYMNFNLYLINLNLIT